MQIVRFLGSWRGLMVSKPVHAATAEMNPLLDLEHQFVRLGRRIIQVLLPRWLPILGPSPVRQGHLRCHFVIGCAAP